MSKLTTLVSSSEWDINQPILVISFTSSLHVERPFLNILMGPQTLHSTPQDTESNWYDIMLWYDSMIWYNYMRLNKKLLAGYHDDTLQQKMRKSHGEILHPPCHTGNLAAPLGPLLRLSQSQDPQPGDDETQPFVFFFGFSKTGIYIKVVYIYINHNLSKIILYIYVCEKQKLL